MKKLFILLFALLGILLVQLTVCSAFHKESSQNEVSYSPVEAETF